MTLLHDINGSLSSKRVFGMCLVIAGIVGHFLKLENGTNMALIITGGGLLGVTVLEKQK